MRRRERQKPVGRLLFCDSIFNRHFEIGNPSQIKALREIPNISFLLSASSLMGLGGLRQERIRQGSGVGVLPMPHPMQN